MIADLQTSYTQYIMYHHIYCVKNDKTNYMYKYLTPLILLFPLCNAFYRNSFCLILYSLQYLQKKFS
jgi:hypothetical protein